jgi:RNA polymerase sigma-70 factor (ECF subfamily)
MAIGRATGPCSSPTGRGTPERELLSGEAREILEDGLAFLPAHYRAILVLRDVEELSNEEVADALGESVASVKSRLHRARMALREVLTRRLGREGHA